MIPKIFHRIWVGKNPIPDEYQKYWETWKRLNPDSVFITWDDDRIKHFNLINKKVFESCKSYSEQSDVVRYELLFRIGGFYVDADFECNTNFVEFTKYCKCFAGYLEGTTIASGLMGSVPNNSLFQLCISNLESNYRVVPDCWTIGPMYFTAVVAEWLKNPVNSITLFEREIFYPYHYTEKVEDSINKLYAAIHHWGTSYRKPEGLRF